MDILCHDAEEGKICFVVGLEEDRKIDAEYPYKDNSLPSGVLKNWDLSKANIPFADTEPLLGKGFCYLGAEHIGPFKEFSTTEWNREGMNPLGNRGEYAVPFLASEGEHFRVFSVNVGYGIPYVLPLVVALLTADPEGLLIIENPESHLHPRGQSKMADLIARVAGQGTQIICESHSDHLINGIRIAAKKGVLLSCDLSIVYFEKEPDQMTRTTEIKVDRDGNLSEYPEGLLDEWGIQMAALI